MLLINAVNVNDAYRDGLRLLWENGIRMESRVGPVKVISQPVTTRYTHPMQRVIFDAQRDANPFFHLFEALWMLAGRNDLGYLTQFLPSFADFSDDGRTLHGAYGYRWRRHFGYHYRHDTGIGEIDGWQSIDQLAVVAKMLVTNPNDRRAIVQMWDVTKDLDANSKDIPCNDMIKFRIVDGRLDMYVFCRSNDAILGCYGANAVHMAFLLEYMAARINVPVGVYEQISADFHMYVEKPYKLEKYWPLYDSDTRGTYRWINPYLKRVMHVYPLVNEMATFDRELEMVVNQVASEKFHETDLSQFDNTFFVKIAQPMYQAFRRYKAGDPMLAAEYLHAVSEKNDKQYDWLINSREWLMRRKVPKKTTAVLGAMGMPAIIPGETK